MPITNDILPFATDPSANVVDQATYAADPSTALGFQSGIAKSASLNKAWRQSGFMAAGLAGMLATRGFNVLDNGDLAALVANLQSAIPGPVLTNVAAIRGLLKTGSPNAFVLGYFTDADGGGGPYYYDSSDTTTADNGGTVIVADDGGRWKLSTTSVSVTNFGAVSGRTAAQNTAAIQAAVTAIQGTGAKLVFPTEINYTVSDVITVQQPITIDGQMVQIYQETPNKNVFVFDKGVGGTGNYQYAFNVQNIVAATIAGSGEAFVFRNILESTFKNLYVPGVGAKAFHFQGCLLDDIEHLYAGDGLVASPGFFVGGLPTNVDGFLFEDYNGLGCNNNLIKRCTATNSTGTAFDISGKGNTLISCDAEGISGAATHMILRDATNVIGGDFEGSGNGIQVEASGCVVHGVNALTYVEIFDGVHSSEILGGTIKYMVIDAGATFNSIEDIQIAAGGALVDNSVGGTNTLRNITNPAGVEIGNYVSGAFSPLLKLGGDNVGMTFYNNEGKYQRDGNLLYFQLWIYVNDLGSSVGALTIDLNDLPFASANVSADQIIPLCGMSELVITGAGNGNAVYTLRNASKIIDAWKTPEATGVNTTILNTDVTHLTQIRLSGTFSL